MTQPDAMTEADLGRSARLVSVVDAAVASKVVGQRELRTALLVALMTEGHLLVESVPGLAKTLAASTLAEAVGARFSRIQCTPDLLPSDIIGTQVYDPREHLFETQLGPVHANVVLLDEVNRASAKTQSAMLEAMQERQTSIAGEVHPLPRPFLVLATQNPIDDEGTYVLPQAQMDRFLLKEVLDYPSIDEEVAVLGRIADGTLGSRAGEGPRGSAAGGLAPRPADGSAAGGLAPRPADVGISLEEVVELQSLVARVHVDPAITRYIVSIVDATRRTATLLPDDLAAYVETGASPRASIAFFQVARALALLAGRSYVVPDDVKQLRHAVLRHRLRLSFDALADRVQPETVIDAVFDAVPAP